MTHILLTEDNRTLAAGMRTALVAEGYRVTVARSGEEALAVVAAESPDLLLLDLMLPGMDGFDVLRQLRDHTNQMPVIVVSARGSEGDKVAGLRLADDYLTKPFSIRELFARVEAVLRRTRLSVNEQLVIEKPRERIGPFVIDRLARRVTRDGATISLRPREFDLLLCLVQRRDSVVSRGTLLEQVWGYDRTVSSRTVDAHVVELRKKLGDDSASPQWIVTVRKAGYCFRSPAADERAHPPT
jgi:two-component system alkaline phosphatase synthesis response regulator PhoP